MKTGLNRTANSAPRTPNREASPGTIDSGFAGLRAGSTRGVALVITLIMLSVITFMTVAFLVLSSRERRSVATTTDQATARFAADTALQRAETEILSRMLAFTNVQNLGLMVSTNFINPIGFDPAGIADIRFRTNINFDHTVDGKLLTLDQVRQVLTNLLYDPRVPVIITNRAAANSQDFRFYLDLNRNGLYDTNGYLPALSPDPLNPYYNAINGLPMPTLTVDTLSNYFAGDPEWIGVLEYPDRPHSANNKFISRYAYLVVPAGQTLDVNAIHNESRSGGGVLDAAHEGFTRNQGVGSWEINLAAFLVDLNTNQWAPGILTNFYAYNVGVATPFNRGVAFDDARALLTNRYAGDYNSLFPASRLMANGAANFLNDGIDEYSDGPFMTGSSLRETLPTRDFVLTPWAGADNTNHFFTPQEFFDPAKASAGFSNRLWAAGATNSFYPAATNSSYDRYTFYRMLAQLGTDSAPENDKVNVNYRNVNNGVYDSQFATNLLPWVPTDFFASAANKLLGAYTAEWFDENSAEFFETYGMPGPFGLTNIPVLISGGYCYTNFVPDPRFPQKFVEEVHSNFVANRFTYTPALHRILQLAANIYDATTNQVLLKVGTTNFVPAPTVWRPIFRRNPGDVVTNVFIIGYRELTDNTIVQSFSAPRMVDLDDPVDRRNLLVFGTPVRPIERNEPLVYGIPLVIGAKKGLPNFNKFALQNAISVSRKLNFHRALGSSTISWTNQLYTLGVASSFGVQAWNSYLTNFTRPVQMIVAGDVSLAVTNLRGTLGYATNTLVFPLTNDIVFTRVTNITDWAGWPGRDSALNNSFIVPLLTNYAFLPDLTYQFIPNRFVTSSVPGQVNTFPVPRWTLLVKTRLRYALVDRETRRILDYVNLSASEVPLNIIDWLRLNAPCDGNLPSTGDPDPGSLWCTNRLGNPTAALGAFSQAIDNNISLPTYGMMNQIEISMGLPQEVSDNFWRSFNGVRNQKHDEIEEFNNRMFGDPTQLTSPDDLDFSTPFNPVRTIYQYVRWEANDPLVHYTITDLLPRFNVSTNMDWDQNDHNPVKRLIQSNPLADHYDPWGGNPKQATAESSADPYRFLTSVKDPLVTRSDDWDFPTNHFPNIGWLGRVHRGTPWQTIYMKSSRAEAGNWTNWSGNSYGGFYRYTNWNGNIFSNFYTTEWRSDYTNIAGWSTNFTGLDFTNSMPTGDRLVFDLFTTAINDNATRGQLSVNQPNLAAWSALLSGVIVLTNPSPTAPPEPVTIQPAGVYNLLNPPPLVRIVNGINNTRLATFTLPSGVVTNVFPNRVFNRKGDILATPELTEKSPFLDVSQLASTSAGGINDEVLERIPQQIMSLVTLNRSPRFVVYAYGQALQPADQSIYAVSGPFFGLCTNYQITAEAATRAVVRVDGSFDPRYTNDAVHPYPDPFGRFYPPRLVVEQFNVLPPD